MDDTKYPGIYDDMRRMADTIASRPARTPEPEKKPVITATKKPDHPTVGEIAAMIRPPMKPVSDTNGWLCDLSTFVIKCDKNHIHRYFVHDIVSNGGVMVCQTCGHDNRFTRLVRETAESLLGVPFARASATSASASATTRDSVNITYSNPRLRVIITCVRDAGEDTVCPTRIRGEAGILIALHTTKSERKIRDFLAVNLEHHTAIGPERQKRLSDYLKPPPPVIQPDKIRPIYQRDPLPFGQELACINIRNAPNPILTQMQLNINDDPRMCLENC